MNTRITVVATVQLSCRHICYTIVAKTTSRWIVCLLMVVVLGGLAACRKPREYKPQERNIQPPTLSNGVKQTTGKSVNQATNAPAQKTTVQTTGTNHIAMADLSVVSNAIHESEENTDLMTKEELYAYHLRRQGAPQIPSSELMQKDKLTCNEAFSLLFDPTVVLSNYNMQHLSNIPGEQLLELLGEMRSCRNECTTRKYFPDDRILSISKYLASNDMPVPIKIQGLERLSLEYEDDYVYAGNNSRDDAVNAMNEAIQLCRTSNADEDTMKSCLDANATMLLAIGYYGECVAQADVYLKWLNEESTKYKNHKSIMEFTLTTKMLALAKLGRIREALIILEDTENKTPGSFSDIGYDTIKKCLMNGGKGMRKKRN